jgi:hypothetical protein
MNPEKSPLGTVDCFSVDGIEKTMIYQLKVKGELDQSWSAWLGSCQIDTQFQPDGSVMTTLTVDAVDQSVLFGILDRIRDLNIPLISVTKNGLEI